MIDWKRRLLPAYYWTTQPLRGWAARHAARVGRVPLLILYYHRVADDRLNSWTLSTDEFLWQLDDLRKQFEFLSLAELQARMTSGANTRPAVSITFDDGYADNCAVALPRLIAEGIPVTYFVTLEPIVTGRPFAHDLAVADSTATCQVPRPNSLDQLRELVEAGVEIGGHSRTHPHLGAIDDDRLLFDEIAGARTELSRLVGRAIRSFAIPFGLRDDTTPRVLQAVRDAGYEAVCSAYGGYNLPGDDPFHLRRIPATDDRWRWRNWLSVDPLRLIQQRRRRDDQLANRAASKHGGDA